MIDVTFKPFEPDRKFPISNTKHDWWMVKLPHVPRVDDIVEFGNDTNRVVRVDWDFTPLDKAEWARHIRVTVWLARS